MTERKESAILKISGGACKNPVCKIAYFSSIQPASTEDYNSCNDSNTDIPTHSKARAREKYGGYFSEPSEDTAGL